MPARATHAEWMARIRDADHATLIATKDAAHAAEHYWHHAARWHENPPVIVRPSSLDAARRAAVMVALIAGEHARKRNWRNG